VALLFIAAMAQLWAGLPTATCAVQAREKEGFHHSGAQKRLRLTPKVYRAGNQKAGSDFPNAWFNFGVLEIIQVTATSLVRRVV
jgi:hypothetical protein